MVATAEEVTSHIRWTTPDEGRDFFDVQARHLLGISGDEFLRRWDAGEYDELVDDSRHPEILRLAVLIPFAR